MCSYDVASNQVLWGTGKWAGRLRIQNNSQPGDAVYDPFVGSGTTIIAAEMSGRKCLAIEINAAYVDVCIERRQTFTEEKATLDG